MKWMKKQRANQQPIYKKTERMYLNILIKALYLQVVEIYAIDTDRTWTDRD